MSLDVHQSNQLVQYLTRANSGNDAEQRRCADALVRLMADKAYATTEERHKQILAPNGFPPLSQATHHLGVRNIIGATLIAHPRDATAFLADVLQAAGGEKGTHAFLAGCVVGTMEVSGTVWHDLLESSAELQFDEAVASVLINLLSGGGKDVPALRKGDASIFSSAVATYVQFPLSFWDAERHAIARNRCVGTLLERLKPIRNVGYTTARLGDQFLHEMSYKLMPGIADGHRMNFVFRECGVKFNPLPPYLGHA